MRSHSATLLACALLACAGPHRSADPTLAFALGRPADAGGEDCALAEWTAPWGKSYRMCRDASTEIEIEHRDIHGFRIEDRQFGDQTRYFVTVRLANQFVDPLAETLRSAEKLYAVLVDGEVSVEAG